MCLRMFSQARSAALFAVFFGKRRTAGLSFFRVLKKSYFVASLRYDVERKFFGSER